MDKAVVAIHREGSEWATMVVASRKVNGQRFITPFIFIATHSPLDVLCPYKDMVFRLNTASLKEGHRTEVLKQAVENHLAEIQLAADVREVAYTGLLRNVTAAIGKRCLFNMGSEPRSVLSASTCCLLASVPILALSVLSIGAEARTSTSSDAAPTSNLASISLLRLMPI